MLGRCRLWLRLLAVLCLLGLCSGVGLSLLLQISLSLVETLGGRRRRRDNRPVFLQVTVLVHRGDCEGAVHE